MSEYQFCTDCYFVHHFGEISEECQNTSAGVERNAECVAAYDKLGGDLFVSDNTDSNAGYETHGGTDTCAVCENPIEFHPAWPEKGFPAFWAHKFNNEQGRPSIECWIAGDEDDIATRSFDTGITEFTWSRCDCCGTNLGGSRHRMEVEEHSGS